MWDTRRKSSSPEIVTTTQYLHHGLVGNRPVRSRPVWQSPCWADEHARFLSFRIVADDVDSTFGLGIPFIRANSVTRIGQSVFTPEPVSTWISHPAVVSAST